MLHSQIRAKLAMLRVVFRVLVRLVLPRSNYKKVYEHLKIDEAVTNAENYFEMSKDVFNKILELVFDFADVDNSGNLSESECKNFKEISKSDCFL